MHLGNTLSTGITCHYEVLPKQCSLLLHCISSFFCKNQTFKGQEGCSAEGKTKPCLLLVSERWYAYRYAPSQKRFVRAVRWKDGCYGLSCCCSSLTAFWQQLRLVKIDDNSRGAAGTAPPIPCGRSISITSNTYLGAQLLLKLEHHGNVFITDLNSQSKKSFVPVSS